MKSRWNSMAVGGCNVIGVALLALSVTAGGSAVRAAGDAAVLDSVALEPLMKLAEVFQQRIAKIEASVAALSDSFNNKRVAQELCIADGSGAQTCITKAQLDALLKGAVQTAQAAPAPASHPAEQAACPEKCVPTDAAITAAASSETPPAAEPPAVKETAAAEPAAKEAAAAKEPATKEPATPEAASAGAKEAARPEASAPTPAVKDIVGKETAAPEGAAAAVPHATEQPAAAAAPVAAEAVIPTLQFKSAEVKPAETAEVKATETKAAETVIATAAKPETLIPAATPAKQEEAAKTAPATTGSTVQEPKAVQVDAPVASEHKE